VRNWFQAPAWFQPLNLSSEEAGFHKVCFSQMQLVPLHRGSRSLKELSAQHLGIEIQGGEHSSVGPSFLRVSDWLHGEPLHVRYVYTGIRVLAPYKKRVPNPQLVSKLLYGVRTRLGYGKDRTCSGSTRTTGPHWTTLDHAGPRWVHPLVF
jgi:hypothetical protein